VLVEHRRGDEVADHAVRLAGLLLGTLDGQPLDLDAHLLKVAVLLGHVEGQDVEDGQQGDA